MRDEDKKEILSHPNYIKKALNFMVKSALEFDEVESILASDQQNVFEYLAEESPGSIDTTERSFTIFSSLMKSFPGFSQTFVNAGGIQLLIVLLKVRSFMLVLLK